MKQTNPMTQIHQIIRAKRGTVPVEIEVAADLLMKPMASDEMGHDLPTMTDKETVEDGLSEEEIEELEQAALENKREQTKYGPMLNGEQ